MDTLKIIMLEQNETIECPGNLKTLGEVQHLNIDKIHCNLKNADSYGRMKGIYHVWKNNLTDYICINKGNVLPVIGEKELQQVFTGKRKMILTRAYNATAGSLQEMYREQYCGYDFQIILSILKRFYPGYYEFTQKEVLPKQELYMFCGVFPRTVFQKVCRWIFEILELCVKLIPQRASEYQNKYAEYLAEHLFNIYIRYHYKEEQLILTTPQILQCESITEQERQKPDGKTASVSEIEKYMDDCMQTGKVEEAASYALHLPRERKELQYIRQVFLKYDQERRYRRLTCLDEGKSWRVVAQEITKEKMPSPGILSGKPKMLIFKWNSIGHKVNVQALESFGFECHTIKIPYNIHQFDERCLEQINCHLDVNQFDVVFSLNCIGMVAEACYVHNIPYVAWCYDSPSFTGNRWYLNYPTTYVFAFDSDDARRYREAGITQAYYMPLAVNLDYFDKIHCSVSDQQKYSADVSFVGSLYESKLPEAMGYLTDYQKGYLNALMDTQLDIYGHSFFPEILSFQFMDWLNQSDFNRLINSEWEKTEPTDKTVNPGRLQLLLNKQTTNKERILLLNLLAQHFKVNLYSYRKSEALKNLNFCGTVDYYTEMPKVFRNSRINLNATLRSILHGIPLRCLDIMGCHGLLLTNYQKDFDDHFVDGQNLLFYTSAEEALDKAKFYLEHESLRAQIAEAGYDTVKKYYDYPVKLPEIFHMAGLDDLIPRK